MIEFRAELPIWNDTLELYAKESRDGRVYAITCEGIQIKEANTSAPWPPFVNLPLMSDSGQSLFDALWRAGYRPKNGESSGAHVEALKYHLEDMRSLALRRPSTRKET